VKTGRTQEAVGRYINAHDQVPKHAKKRDDAILICQFAGLSLNSNRE